ncbi:MAG: transglutaminase domain-containing protein [Candidatus Aminicenantes bacterium]|nr:transglutaminase domain-containing protein [Candidatus Aminicenantes bacterium]
MARKIPRRLVLPLAVTAALLAILSVWLARRPGVRISTSPVSARKSNYDFIPEHWKESKLRALREQEDFKDISASDQLDLFLNLCDWTHRQWPTSVPDPYPLSNAIDILADIRAGKTGGFCGQYAYVLADVLKAMGFFAVRYVELWSDGGESHFLVEAWSDQFAKWMILDPGENIYYAFAGSGLPAHALEVRAARGQPEGIAARSADASRSHRGRHKMHLYANIAFSTRSDLMRLARPLTVRDRFDMFVLFKDGNSDPDAFGGRIPYTRTTSRVEDIYFDCNYARVEHRIDRTRGEIHFAFYTDGSMFNFARFAVSTDQGKNWRPSGAEMALPLGKGAESFWVAPVNMAGRFGRPTRVEISED